MPVQLFTAIERERLDRFPHTVEHDDLITFFTLSDEDKARIPVYSAASNRLGFALQLCTLRFIGFVPDALTGMPNHVVEHVASQLGVTPRVLASYGARAHTRTDHLQEVLEYLGYRRASRGDLKELSRWLLERALEHDKPSLLYTLTCEWLRSEKILRPGVTRLERLIAESRQDAQGETLRRLGPVLTEACRAALDGLLVPAPSSGGTNLSWLRRAAVANTPKAVLRNLEKLAFLKALDVHKWNLETLSPNRRKLLAQTARRSTARALQKYSEERRYPVLVAFLHQSLVDIHDETIDLFICRLADAYARAGHDLEDFRRTTARATNEKVKLFCELARTVLDPSIRDAQLRRAIYQRIPADVLQNAVEESDKIIRPIDDSFLFPGQKPDRPVALRTVQMVCQRALKASGLSKHVHMHTLRHNADSRIMPTGVFKVT